MDIVQQISFSFNLCAKKLLAFHEHLETDATVQEALHNRKKLLYVKPDGPVAQKL